MRDKISQGNPNSLDNQIRTTLEDPQPDQGTNRNPYWNFDPSSISPGLKGDWLRRSVVTSDNYNALNSYINQHNSSNPSSILTNRSPFNDLMYGEVTNRRLNYPSPSEVMERIPGNQTPAALLNLLNSQMQARSMAPSLAPLLGQPSLAGLNIALKRRNVPDHSDASLSRKQRTINKQSSLRPLRSALKMNETNPYRAIYNLLLGQPAQKTATQAMPYAAQVSPQQQVDINDFMNNLANLPPGADINAIAQGAQLGAQAVNKRGPSNIFMPKTPPLSRAGIGLPDKVHPVYKQGALNEGGYNGGATDGPGAASGLMLLLLSKALDMRPQELAGIMNVLNQAPPKTAAAKKPGQAPRTPKEYQAPTGPKRKAINAVPSSPQDYTKLLQGLMQQLQDNPLSIGLAGGMQGLDRSSDIYKALQSQFSFNPNESFADVFGSASPGTKGVGLRNMASLPTSLRGSALDSMGQSDPSTDLLELAMQRIPWLNEALGKQSSHTAQLPEWAIKLLQKTSGAGANAGRTAVNALADNRAALNAVMSGSPAVGAGATAGAAAGSQPITEPVGRRLPTSVAGMPLGQQQALWIQGNRGLNNFPASSSLGSLLRRVYPAQSLVGGA